MWNSGRGLINYHGYLGLINELVNVYTLCKLLSVSSSDKVYRFLEQVSHVSLQITIDRISNVSGRGVYLISPLYVPGSINQ